MIKALEERKREREEAINRATRFVHKLRAVIGPLAGILYGSFARGDFHLGSDIDVLVISDSLPAFTLERMELLYRYVEGGIEPKGYTREEFQRMKKSGNPTVLGALKEGVVLWDDGFLPTV